MSNRTTDLSEQATRTGSAFQDSHHTTGPQITAATAKHETNSQVLTGFLIVGLTDLWKGPGPLQLRCCLHGVGHCTKNLVLHKPPSNGIKFLVSDFDHTFSDSQDTMGRETHVGGKDIRQIVDRPLTQRSVPSVQRCNSPPMPISYN